MAERDHERETRRFPSQAVQLIRTAVQTHLVLSRMADQKASLLMGANFLVFTITVGQAARSSLPVPLIILAVFSFFSAICAVLVVMPSVFTPPADKEGSNMLFFGVFTQFSEQEFADYVVEQMANEETMFRTMLRDLYQNGLVLQRKKYRLLRIAYALLIAGLGFTLASFLFGFSDEQLVWIPIPN